jgi:hypothetical protein
LTTFIRRRFMFLCCALLLAACSSPPSEAKVASFKAEASRYLTCRQLHIKVPLIPPLHQKTPSIIATAHSNLSTKTIDAVETDGPAACAATQYAANQKTILVFLCKATPDHQVAVLRIEEIGYLRATGLFRSVTDKGTKGCS